MDEEDLLDRIQRRGRLHGRNASRRAVGAVVEALGEFLPARAYHLIVEQLPAEVRERLASPAVRSATPPTCRGFLMRIGRRLHLDGPDVAFTARVVLEQLNAARRVLTPAAFAHLVAPDLRALLCARPAGQPAIEQLAPPRRVIRVPAATVAVVPDRVSGRNVA